MFRGRDAPMFWLLQDQNLTKGAFYTKILSATFSVLRPTDFFKPYFNLFGKTLTSTCTYRPIRNPYLKNVEVQGSNLEVKRSTYRKGPSDAYPPKVSSNNFKRFFYI